MTQVSIQSRTPSDNVLEKKVQLMRLDGLLQQLSKRKIQLKLRIE